MNLALSFKNFLGGESFGNYKKGVKFAFYAMRRPLDGFWDLTHEGRGHMWAAHTFVLLRLIVEILRTTSSNFQFVPIHMEAYNVLMTVAQVLVPILLWCVANWSLTTLMDGKGKFSHIYMALAYALVPWTLIDAALIPVSHMLTFDEGAMYWAFTSFGILYFGFLLIVGMMQIHDYTMRKTLFSSLASLVAIGVLVFIFIMFFAVVTDAIAYFVSVFQEIWFRII